MSFKCSVCGKAPVAGRTYVYRGIAIKKGGIGLKVTGKTKRRFLPNLQKIKVKTASGRVRTVKACTRCIKARKIGKA